MARVLYPGSFDPIHLGHLDVVEQAVELFGEVIVVAMYNPAKDDGMFHLDERLELVRASVAHLDGVIVEARPGLVVDAARDLGVDFIVKGLRTPADFEVEQQMAHTNRSVTGIRTVYVSGDPALSYVSSRFIREIARYGGDVGHLVPPPVAERLARSAPTGETTR